MKARKLAVGCALVVACVAAGAVPAAATAPSLGAAPRPSPLSRALRTGEGLDPAAAAALASYRRSPHAERFLAALLQAEQIGSARFVYSEPVHDVTGDGAADVLSLDYSIRVFFEPGLVFADFRYEARVIIRLLRGSDGKLMWTKRAHFENGFMDVVEARTGPRGRNGFALLVYDGAVGPVEQRRFTIRAVTGAGKRLWARTYETVAVEEFPVASYVNIPVTLGTFDALRPRPTDYLVGLADLATVPGAWVADVRAVVVDGGAGAQTVHPTPEVSAGEHLAAPWPTYDLSGDRLDDYVFVNPNPQLAQGEETRELGGVVRGRRGTNGDLLWERGGFDFTNALAVWPYPVRDVVGNPFGDLFLTAWIHDEARMREGTDFDLYLIDGASGGPRWKRIGAWPYVPGDINGDGEDDVIARGVGASRQLTDVVMKLWAYTTGGKTLWKNAYHVRTGGPLSCTPGCGSSAGTWFGSAGDLQPDGIVDSYVAHHVEHNPGTQTWVRYLVDGRTGRRSLMSGKELFPLATALDLRGTDVARVTWSAGDLSVDAATSGDAPLWNSIVSLGLPSEPTGLELDVVSVRLDRDRCPDVIVAIAARQGRYTVALDGGDGSLLWARTLDGPKANAGARTGADRNDAC